MKKLLSVLIASLLILSLCSCGNPAKKAVDINDPAMSEDVVKENTQEKEGVKKQSEQVDKVPEEKDIEPKNDDAKVMEDAELLEELKGFYISKKYVDTYKETKSQLKAAENRVCMWVFDREGAKFEAMMGDLHQGGPVFGDVDSIKYENDKYTLTTLPVSDSETGILKMTYTPGSNVVQINASGNGLWENYYSAESTQEFYKYAYDIDVSADITKAMLEGISNVDIKDDGAYIEVDGTEYILEFALDSVVTEPIDYMETCDGYLYIYPVGAQECMVGQYSYDDGKLTIASERVNLVLE